jgi:hypothetical protein
MFTTPKKRCRPNSNASFKLKRPFRSALNSVGFLALLLGLILPTTAEADFGIAGASVSLNGPTGAFSRQAGGHPDFFAHFDLNHDPDTNQLSANPKDVAVSLPPGFFANPDAAPVCKFSELTEDLRSTGPYGHCPLDSQVGTLTVEFKPNDPDPGHYPIFNMPHPPDSPALFGVKVILVPVFIKAKVDPVDFSITGLSINTSQALAVFGADVTLFGVPGDHGVPVSPRPFFTSSTSCPGVALPFRFSVDSWAEPGVFSTKTVIADAEGTPFINEGCEKLRFEPSLSIVTGSHQAAAPTGISVDVNVPQNEDPDGLATPQVKKTVISLPKGVAISASAANGLTSCPKLDMHLGTNEPPTCPDSSKVGTVVVKSPLLDEELFGNVILAKQNDNPFPNPSLLALYFSVKGPGFYLKFPGKTEMNPETGQVTTTFDNTPQLPFESLKVNIDSGPRAALTTPEQCGTYSTKVEMTPWSGTKPVTVNSPIEINEGCDTGGFSPGLNAGAVNPLGGRYSPFTVQVTRKDGEQNLSRIKFTLPPGEAAKLAGVPLCSEADIAAGHCPEASKVGTVTVGAGVGANPTYIPEAGKPVPAIYLAGPYKGTAYSFLVQVPAQAGPLDVGVVNTRVSLAIDPLTAQVTTISDPLPQLLEGIPIKYRDIRVEVNRPNFTLNPTSCNPMKVTSSITSNLGNVASPFDSFQMASCDSLAFAPKLKISLKGGTKRGKFPALKAVLTQPAGQANIARTSVALPHSEFLAQEHIRTVCTRVQFNAGAGNGAECPTASIYGKARAYSPLIDKPLEGPVLLRSSSNPLPDLVLALHGAFDIDVVGRIDTVKGGIRNTFDAIPDAPVSKFVLEMQGGKKGLLVNSTNLCSAPNRATVKIDGQNGKFADAKPMVGNSCGGKGKKSKAGRIGRISW